MTRPTLIAKPALAVFACVALAGCSSAPEISSILTPYRIDVRQGNFVTREMTRQLRTGQTKDQVRFILGTPLVTDLFHGDRWDYLYRFQPGRGGDAQERRLTVYFADGKLARVAGDVIADESIAEQDRAMQPATGVIEIRADTPVSGNGNGNGDGERAAPGGVSMKVDTSMSRPGGK